MSRLLRARCDLAVAVTPDPCRRHMKVPLPKAVKDGLELGYTILIGLQLIEALAWKA